MSTSEGGEVYSMPSVLSGVTGHNEDQDFWKGASLLTDVEDDITNWKSTLSFKPCDKEKDFLRLMMQVTSRCIPGTNCLYAHGRASEAKIVIAIPCLTATMNENYSLSSSGDPSKVIDSLVSYGAKPADVMVISVVPFFPRESWKVLDRSTIPEYVQRIFVPYFRGALEVIKPHTVIILNSQAADIIAMLHRAASMTFDRLAKTVKTGFEEQERGAAPPKVGMLESSARVRVSQKQTVRVVRLASPSYMANPDFASSTAVSKMGGVAEAMKKQSELIKSVATFVPEPPPSSNAFDRLMGKSSVQLSCEPGVKRQKIGEMAFGGRLLTLAQPSSESTLCSLSARSGYLVWYDASTHKIVHSQSRKGVTYTHLPVRVKPDERWSANGLHDIVNSITEHWKASKKVAVMCNDGVRECAIIKSALMMRVFPTLGAAQAIDLAKVPAWGAWAGETELGILRNLETTYAAVWRMQFRTPKDRPKPQMRILRGIYTDPETSQYIHFGIGCHTAILSSVFLEVVAPLLMQGYYVYSVDGRGERVFAGGVPDPDPRGTVEAGNGDAPAEILWEFLNGPGGAQNES